MRTFLHIAIQPLLAIALMTGSQGSLCETASVLGFDAHHHAEASSECPDHHGHDDGDRIPCNEDCQSKLTEASNPQILKTPQTPQPSLYAMILAEVSPLSSPTTDLLVVEPRLSSEPPDTPAILASPPFTGRFLI